MQRITNGIVLILVILGVAAAGPATRSLAGSAGYDVKDVPAEARQYRQALQRQWLPDDVYCRILAACRRGRRDRRDLKPRNGSILVVGIVARISGCAQQKEMSLDDQVDHGKQAVAEIYSGAVEYRIIQTTGKGERLDRPELAAIEEMLRSRELDLLVAEDLGRIVRGTAAKDLAAVAVDCGTRVIVPNDFLDTDDETWEEDFIASCRDHVGHNSHTSKRLKHKLMNRFKKFGGAIAREIAGYLVPEDATTYSDWRKDEDAAAVITEGFRRLQLCLNGGAVADYFNTVPYKEAVGFPTGPYCRQKRWTGVTVLRFYRNRTLSGRPGRGFRHTIKRHQTGRRISVRNPDGPVYKDFEHLRFVDPVEQDQLIDLLDRKNQKFRPQRSTLTCSTATSVMAAPQRGHVMPAAAVRCASRWARFFANRAWSF